MMWNNSKSGRVTTLLAVWSAVEVELLDLPLRADAANVVSAVRFPLRLAGDVPGAQEIPSSSSVGRQRSRCDDIVKQAK